jgi:superoxide dismutase
MYFKYNSCDIIISTFINSFFFKLMIKNILLILIGMVVGGVITAGAMFFLYKQSILPAPIEDLGIKESVLTPEDQQRALDTKPIKLAIPESVVSKKYNDLVQQIINSNNNIVKNNNEVVYPTMIDLKNRSIKGNWEGVFDVIAKGNLAVKANLEIVKNMKEDIYTLQAENNATTKNTELNRYTQIFTQKGLDLADAHTAYFTTLSQFLTGKVPTKELADELNTRISSLQKTQKDFQTSTSQVFTLIDTLLGTNAGTS